MKYIALSLLLMTSHSFSDQTEEAHASIGSRPCSIDLQTIKMQNSEDLPLEETREKPRQEVEANEHNQGFQKKLGLKPQRKNKGNAHLFSQYPQFTNHWFISSNIDGSVIELEDGSQWKMAPNHATCFWRHGDKIEISPNTSWSSDYSYYIVNRTTGRYIPADLILGPIAYGPLSHWVIGMDPFLGKVYLENGSAWKVSSQDELKFKDWQINDTIIFARNSSWFSSYDHVLINVNLNQYIHVRQY